MLHLMRGSEGFLGYLEMAFSTSSHARAVLQKRRWYRHKMSLLPLTVLLI
jgi:hypothetical protein